MTIGLPTFCHFLPSGGPRRPRSTGARVERQGPFEANKNEVRKQDVEYLVMLEETRESAGANDDGPFPVERPILNLLRQPADDGPVAEVQPRLDSFDRRSTHQFARWNNFNVRE